jgi:Flp pilus assembly protein TadD
MVMGRRLTAVVAFAVFLIAMAVYMITLTPTVPFWDAGEFIAVARSLGIPHPPGTPTYVLIARIFTMIPWASVAQRVNALSAFSSALAVMLTYLVALRLIRGAMRERLTPATDWIAHVGAVVGALMLAFSDAYWENSIEAEVYQMMSLAQILVLWLGLRWWDEHEQKPSVGLLLVAVYVMWLSVGLHLGVGVMGLPLLVMVAIADRRVALLFLMPFLSVLLCTAGLERMAGAVLLLSTITFFGFAFQRKLSWYVVLACALPAFYGMSVAFGDKSFDLVTGSISALSVAVPLAVLAGRHKEGRILALALLLMVVGYSTHVYLPIRAAQHPSVNEGAPATWDALRDLLERKQYGQMNMFVRRAPLAIQLDKEFWRYFSRQWPVLPIDNRALASVLALTLGIVGAGWQAARDPRRWLPAFVFFGLNTAGLIVFLNFSDHEVRDRDYFFQSGYHAFALWIAVGCAWLALFVREATGKEGAPGTRVIEVITAALLLSQPLLLARNLWFEHDRRGNYVARDYAYNMLAPLAPDSYVFTNGDNDTFPLWYIQEVEGFRKDVRVVNMSLLNTDWYIKQLRDQEPKLPVRLDDQLITKGLGEGLLRIPPGFPQALADSVLRPYLGQGGGLTQDGVVVLPDGKGGYKPIYTNDYVARHIVENSRLPGGKWTKQPYFAVTVPDHVGFDRYFTLEGLVYRINPDTTGPEIDEAVTRKALYETFRYRGLFKPDGSWDDKVYKDENSETLSRNYAAAHINLAFLARRTGRLPLAIGEMERVQRMFPSFSDVLMPLGGFYMEAGDSARALALYEDLVRRDPGNAEAHYYLAVSLALKGEFDRAAQEFDAAIRFDPNLNVAYYSAYSLLWGAGRREQALRYLERWLDGHPEDAQARQLYDLQRRALGGGAAAPPAMVNPLTPQRLP